MNSGNAAGIITDSLARYNTADISYSYDAGSLHLCQKGESESIINFNTQGTADVGRFRLWGSFAYTNTMPEGCTFNTLLYDPSDERYLYNVTDTVSSAWRKQAYDLRMKAAYDLSRAFKLGLELQYSDKLAAKQNDPRSETYDYNITVVPSAVFTTGVFSCGLDALYTNSFVRATPTLSNNQEYQKVYISKGLGTYISETVGGGLQTLSYKGNSFGGGAQVALKTTFSFIADFSYIAHITELTENPTMPKPIGRTNVTDMALQTRFVWGSGLRNVICAGFTSRKTTGTEYSSSQETGAGWVIKTQAAMADLSTLDINLGYDGFVMPSAAGEHTWHFGAYLNYISKNDGYAYPVSTYNYSILAPSLSADRRFFFRKSSLYAGLSFEFSKSLGGEYSYGGKLSGNPLARSWLPHDIEILTLDVIGGSIDLSYRINLARKVSLDIKASGFFRSAFSPYRRYGCNAGIGLVF